MDREDIFTLPSLVQFQNSWMSALYDNCNIVVYCFTYLVTLGHSLLSSLSHCGWIPTLKVELVCVSWSPLIFFFFKCRWGMNDTQSPRKWGKGHHHHYCDDAFHPYQIQRIHDAGLNHEVEVIVKQADCKIELHGHNRGIIHVQHHIKNIISESEQQRQKEEAEELIAKMVQWSYLEVSLV